MRRIAALSIAPQIMTASGALLALIAIRTARCVADIQNWSPPDRAGEPLQLRRRIPHENACVHAFPPVGRILVEFTEVQDGRTGLVGPVGERFHAHIRKERGQKPTMRGGVREAAKRKIAAFRAVVAVGQIQRAVQLLAGADAGHQIQVKHVDADPLAAGVVKEQLPPGRRAAIQIILHQPRCLEVEFVGGMLSEDFKHRVRVAIVQFVDVRLQIGVADVIVDFRADEHLPLFCRFDRVRVPERLVGQRHGDVR